MTSPARYRFRDWEEAALDACWLVDHWSARIQSQGSKACHDSNILVMKMSGVGNVSLPNLQDGKHIGNIKSIIDWYIDSKSWERDPALMVGVDDYSSFYTDRTMHTLLWKTMGAESIAYCRSKQIPIDFNVITNTLIKKQKDYGPKNISRFGLNGLVIRAHDKVARVENLLSKPNSNETAVNDESIYDTLLDISGYAAIAMMWVNRDFLLPLGR
jgi:hypothetical protein